MGGRVKEEAERIFEDAVRVAKISPAFDAPQFCRDWIAVSPSEVKQTRIMVRGPKTGDDGKPVLRKGAPVMTWLAYDEPKTARTAKATRMERATA